MRSHPRTKAGFTWVELLVVIALAVVVVLVIPPFITDRDMLVRAQQTQTLSNTKQLHLATEQMALDGIRDGKTNHLGWPGDTGGTFSNWTTTLVEGNYLSARDLAKLLSAPGISVPTNHIPVVMGETALLLYAVRETSDPATVFLTTANFTNTPTGGLAPLPEAEPYKKYFIVFRKGGDGAILRSGQAGQTNLIGAFAPLVR